MKIAYLCSQYPAVSHTFILREVVRIRGSGLTVGTFSVRRSRYYDILGPEAREEAAATRSLLPVRPGLLLRSVGWALTSRPWQWIRTWYWAITQVGLSFRQRLLWTCYFLEATILARWLVQDRFEHLHCHFANSGSSTGMLAARLAGVPFSITCHASELLDPHRHRLADKVRQATFIACVSKFGKAQLMSTSAPDQWDKLHIIRCGLPKTSAPIRPVRPPQRHILCVGRLSPEKGHAVLLRALAGLRDRGVPFTCTLVGGGPLRAAVEAQIAEWRLENQVTLTGALASDQVLRLYDDADVVVLASFSEGVPVVLMEAMTAGRPVVATRVGGVPELILDGQTGRLVTPGEADELADAIAWMLDHPEAAADLGRQGAAFVRKEFDLDNSITRLTRLFSQAIHNHAGRKSHECKPEPTQALDRLAGS